MARDTGLWTWPIDVAATSSGADRLALGASALYGVGMLMLVANLAGALPATVVSVGLLLVLFGVAGSLAVLGKVVVTRSRLHAR